MTPLTVLTGFLGCMMVAVSNARVLSAHAGGNPDNDALAERLVEIWRTRQRASLIIEEVVVIQEETQMHMLRPLVGGRLYILTLALRNATNLGFARRALREAHDPLGESWEWEFE